MKEVNSGAVIKYEGIIYIVSGFTNDKTLRLRPLENNKKVVCPQCGEEFGIKEDKFEVESCRNFQNGASPIETLKGNNTKSSLII